MRRLASAAAVAALVPLALAGCSFQDALEQRTSGTAATPAALAHAWRTPASEPDWVPEASTDIRYVAATGGPADRSPAAVRVTTTDALPTTCTGITRYSMDAFGEAWAPRSLPDRVQRCGNWAVVRVRGGWFGWSPLAPKEAAEG